MKPRLFLNASAGCSLIALAAVAYAQPTIDGSIVGDESFYGTPVATQQANVIDFLAEPTVSATFAMNNSNVAGKGGYDNPGDVTSLPFPGPPEDVTTGIELCVDLNELNLQPAFGDTIFLAGFVNGQGHDFLSNQVLGGFGAGEDPNNLGEPRGLDFGTFNGDQFVGIDISTPSNTAAVVDGQLDPEYGMSPIWTQNIGTGFGDSSDSDPDTDNGSEIDAVWAFVDSQDKLYVLITGNLETNFNKLDLFFDVRSGGQNEILGENNPDTDFNALRRMGNNEDGSLDGITGGPTGMGAFGLTFDDTFAADYWISYTGGNTPPEHFLNAAELTSSNGVGAFIDGGPKSSQPVLTGTGPRGEGDISVASDLSNILGVGGREPGPGTGSEPDVSAPALVTTGLEFKVNLEGLGYDVSALSGSRGTPENIRIGGFIVGPTWDFLSNQIIGGITTFMGGGSGDPFNLGAPAQDTNFADWDGNQYVDLPVSAPVPDLTSSITTDGMLTTSEQTTYTLLWVNNTNGSGFGDNLGVGDPPMPDPNIATGSEFDALWAAVGEDNGVPTLFVMATGNLHDFNRMQFFVDVNPSLNADPMTAEGQQSIRGDNADVDGNNLNNGLGGVDGLTWDTDFYPDYVLSYAAGVNEDDEPEHFAHGAHLFTEGGGFGGQFDQLLMTDGPVVGDVLSRVGSGDNDDSGDVFANGAELDACYVHVDTSGGFLYLLFTGNLTPDFRNLELFFDTLPGVGQQNLIADNPLTPENDGNPDVDFGALQRMGKLLEVDDSDPQNPQLIEVEPGLTFDSGFEADYYFSFRMGNYDEVADEAIIFGNWARLGDGNTDPGEGRFLGEAITGGGGIFVGGDKEQQGTGFEETLADINNSNTGGVEGGMDQFFGMPAPDPTAVDTGIEIAIELADLGWNGTDQMRFTAFLNGEGHAFVFNQSLQAMCSEDPGEPRQVDFSDESLFPGNQFIGYPTPVAAPPACEAQPEGIDGDANGDGMVNTGDLSYVIFRLGACDPVPGGQAVCFDLCDGDVNGDGSVNTGDLSYIIFRLGTMNPCP